MPLGRAARSAGSTLTGDASRPKTLIRPGDVLAAARRAPGAVSEVWLHLHEAYGL
jgi:hypothetical protein